MKISLLHGMWHINPKMGEIWATNWSIKNRFAAWLVVSCCAICTRSVLTHFCDTTSLCLRGDDRGRKSNGDASFGFSFFIHRRAKRVFFIPYLPVCLSRIHSQCLLRCIRDEVEKAERFLFLFLGRNLPFPSFFLFPFRVIFAQFSSLRL